MHFASLLSFAAFTALATAVTTSVSYDPGYDQPNGELSRVACSDGPNGLITRYGWHTYSNIPNFPNIGGADVISGHGSAQCGSCWRLEFNGHSIFVLAIDRAIGGFNIGVQAMNSLTGGQAEHLGRISAEVTPATPQDCRI